MTATNPSNTSSFPGNSADTSANVPELLAKLSAAAPQAQDMPSAVESNSEAKYENQLALARLGMASSLFYALRSKHRPTAEHSLRVALCCSAWTERMQLSDEERDRIEVAALLHDIGKIGIPDRILRKPGKLTVEEQLTVDCGPRLACEILRGCTSDHELLDIIRYSNTWFDSRRTDDSIRREAIPLGARMLFIATAFDSMTTDHIYRTAMSRERALNELVRGREMQFDPELVSDFCRMLEAQPEMLHRSVVNRWLVQLNGSQASFIGPGLGEQVDELTGSVESQFFDQLLSELQDCVVFVDAEGTVVRWNPAMEQLTGINASAVVAQTWSSDAIGLRDLLHEKHSSSCPVRHCLSDNVAITRPMMLERPGAEPLQVRVRVNPVIDHSDGKRGVLVIIRDVSNQENLERQVESLHHQATSDPLTGIANRAFFNDQLDEFLKRATSGVPFSLVICDIDKFKSVNDIFGHLAGDEALVNFAAVLAQHTREGDVVARYGGEEFVLLASGCDNANATKRAEKIRLAVQQTSLPSLGGKSVTASFGVTEFQPGDTEESIVSRADRALLKAKDNGRNRVVQLGTGPGADNAVESGGMFGWLSRSRGPSQELTLVSPVPCDLVIEKLRGFIADHGAQVISVSETQVSIRVCASSTDIGRRRVDKRMMMNVNLIVGDYDGDDSSMSTKIQIKIQPTKSRDRRRRHTGDCISQIVRSIRSYLLGEIQ